MTTITYTSPFWFSLTFVFIIMFIINYLTQALIIKKKGRIISWGFVGILLVQSLIVTAIFEVI
ncbi:hypothetical protein JCM9157_697 [Halalkalibacter akibai JCM 9157]|uniref:Uncharacterized protein n=1 Tax=Halalkalibacter akibai (strain ATCC 43226 / DSM 21942 / CIP 109018 / JCM 9157 / 1139) TaxID=1236973 RepID=W4QNL1_HALA3|nr:hypothetical protein JCM9157_697 [Halalkalibacter akibai JCM 9157]